jgi:hypothetical protein
MYRIRAFSDLTICCTNKRSRCSFKFHIERESSSLLTLSSMGISKDALIKHYLIKNHPNVTA